MKLAALTRLQRKPDSNRGYSARYWKDPEITAETKRLTRTVHTSGFFDELCGDAGLQVLSWKAGMSGYVCVSERAMSGTLWLFCVWFYFGLHGSTNRNIFLKLTLCGGSKKAFWTLQLCVSCVPVFIGGFVFGQLCFFFSATASSFIHEVYLFFL